MKILKNISALFLAFIILISTLTACADTSYVAQSGNEKFPVSVYAYYVHNIRDYYDLLLQSYGMTDFSQALLEEVSDGVPLYSMIIDAAKSQYLSYVIINKKFDELGLTLSEQKQKEIDEYIDQNYVDVYGEEGLADICRRLNLTGTELKNIASVSFKSEMIMDYYFGEGGEYEVTEEEKRSIYDSDYARFKYVIIGKIDSEGKTLPTNELIEKLNTANDVYARAADGAEFEALIAEYSEDYYKITDSLTEDEKKHHTDSNKVMTEDGVVTDKKGILDYNTYTYYNYTLDSAIIDKLFSINDGDVAMVEVAKAFWIIKKYDKYADEKYYESKENLIYESIVSPISDELYKKWQDEFSLVFNMKVINEYDPRKLKPLYSTNK